MNSAERQLAALVNHRHATLTPRGNAAIFFSLFIAKKMGKKKVLIPDQGGWLTFRTYPTVLGMDMELLKTNDGVIDPQTISLSPDTVLLYAQPAGYFAEQDMKAIYERCKSMLVIADVSGSVGSELCHGGYADILLGSFSEWKPLNIGYGGFVSVKEKEMVDYGKEIVTINKVHPTLEKEVEARLKTCTQRYHDLFAKAEKTKRDLAEYDIIHREKKGINVVIAYKNEKQKDDLISYCKKQQLEYTLCPRFIRVMRPAISIEIKRT